MRIQHFHEFRYLGEVELDQDESTWASHIIEPNPSPNKGTPSKTKNNFQSQEALYVRYSHLWSSICFGLKSYLLGHKLLKTKIYNATCNK